MPISYEFFNTDGGMSKSHIEGGYHKFGNTRSEQDKHLQEEGWGSSFASEEQRDYCKFLEKQIKDNYICGGKVHLRAKHIHCLMKQYGK